MGLYLGLSRAHSRLLATIYSEALHSALRDTKRSCERPNVNSEQHEDPDS